MNTDTLQTDLLLANIIRATAVSTLLILIALCYFYAAEWQIHINEQDRILYRGIFYLVAIISFPIMTFMRHVMLHINTHKSAKFRYLLTIIVMMKLSASISLYGFFMFYLGDEMNTVYIFSGLALLAIYLHRPNKDEYLQLIESIYTKQNHD